MGKKRLNRAVFLDRDGVINHAEVRKGKPFPPRDKADLRLLPKVLESLKDLHETGWLLIVITNQPDVARGFITKDTVEAINQQLQEWLPYITEFRTCFHDDRDGCVCRKPLPGALLEAAYAHKINLAKSFMIGDRWRDIEAGRNAGCKTIFINYDYAEQQPQNYTYKVTTLRQAVDLILLEN